MASGTLANAGDSLTFTGAAGQTGSLVVLYGTYGASAVVKFLSSIDGVAYTPCAAVNRAGGGSASSWALSANSTYAFDLGQVPSGCYVKVVLTTAPASGSMTCEITSASVDTGGAQVIVTTTTMTPDPSLGNLITLNCTTTGVTAYTITTPTVANNGDWLTFVVTAGTTLTAPTFGAVYQLAGASVAPAINKKRNYTFRYDGTSWLEVMRNATDI